MAKQEPTPPLMVRCPNCKQTKEPDLNETTKRYVCPLCGASVHAQVLIEQKKRHKIARPRSYGEDKWE